MGKEDERAQRPGQQQEQQAEATFPAVLPPELAAFLRDQTYACVTQGSDRGTVFVLKAPALDLESLGGPVPIEQRHELYQHPLAPVIRLLTTIYDQPGRPLRFETFINVGDEVQRQEFASLADQQDLYLFFFDEGLKHQLTKRVAPPEPEGVRAILSQAEELRAAIPSDRFDFDRAKEEVMRQTHL